MRVNAAASIYEVVKERVISLEYAPGTFINEVQLAEEFGVSRTPVREVLHRLEQESLISLSKAGALVMPVDIVWMKDAIEVRMVLDPLIARLAAQRATDAEIAALLDKVKAGQGHASGHIFAADVSIHEDLVKMSRSAVLAELLSRLLPRCRQFGVYLQKTTEPEICTQCWNALVRVAEAIAARDVPRAEAYAREHVEAYVYNLFGTRL